MLSYGLHQPSAGSNEVAAWMIDNSLPHGVNSLTSGLVKGYSADIHNNNLIIKDIMMGDGRNGTEYQCVIGIENAKTMVLEVVESCNITILHVAGE